MCCLSYQWFMHERHGCKFRNIIMWPFFYLASIFFFQLRMMRSLSLSFEIFIDFQMSDSLAFHAKDCLSSGNQW